MTDKELLAAAARAAGMPAFASGATGLRVASDGRASGYIWNPLTDDGDALRLAVQLKMDVKQWQSNSIAVALWDKHATEDATQDRYAATRRAIVRAAAEIGSLHNAVMTGPQAPSP